MRRLFLSVLLLVFLFGSDAFAQTEIAEQQIDRGVSNAANNRYDEALKDFQNALEKYRLANDYRNDFAAKSYFNLGVCHYRSGRAEETNAYFETAIKLADGKYAKAFHALGVVQSELGNFKAAKDSLTLALRLDKRDGESWFDLAMVHLRENDLANAVASFRKAVRSGSVDARTAHNNLGVIPAMNGDWLRAKEEFETALAMTSGKLPEAKRNLEICRSQNSSRAFVAKHEFVNRKTSEI